MPDVTLSLSEELYQQFRDAALHRKQDVESLLSTRIHQYRSQLLRDAPSQWMPREQWDALVTGKACPMCCDLKANEQSNGYGYTIADLQASRLRLGSDQFIPGYCVLISKIHVREVYHLRRDDRARYFEDLVYAAQAIEQVFQPLKMNFEMLGNALPHLHCHIKPRYYGDAAPGEPLHPDKGTHFLTPQEYEKRVRLIREALDNVMNNTEGEKDESHRNCL